MITPTALILGIPLLCLALVLVLIVISVSQSMIVTAHKQEAWPGFAKRIGAALQPGGNGKPDQIARRIGEWPFYMDTYVIGGSQSLMQYTRMRAFYPPRAPLEIIICSNELRDEVGQILGQAHGMTQASGPAYGVGAELALWANQLEQLRDLLANPDLVRLIAEVKPLDLQIRRRRNWKGGGVSSAVYEVHLQCNGVVTDSARLMSMYQLVGATLRQLNEMGVAGKSFAE